MKFSQYFNAPLRPLTTLFFSKGFPIPLYKNPLERYPYALITCWYISLAEKEKLQEVGKNGIKGSNLIAKVEILKVNDPPFSYMSWKIEILDLIWGNPPGDTLEFGLFWGMDFDTNQILVMALGYDTSRINGIDYLGGDCDQFYVGYNETSYQDLKSEILSIKGPTRIIPKKYEQENANLEFPILSYIEERKLMIIYKNKLLDINGKRKSL